MVEVEIAGEMSAGVDFASPGLDCAIVNINCWSCAVSWVRQSCQAASLSKSSRRPGKGAPELMFFKHVYYRKYRKYFI